MCNMTKNNSFVTVSKLAAASGRYNPDDCSVLSSAVVYICLFVRSRLCQMLLAIFILPNITMLEVLGFMQLLAFCNIC
jgi:hypothetical protein